MASHAFWVIVDGTTPTAFRAKQRDVLVPTLVQLQRTQPAVVLRWFDRGQLWDSPIAAREALRARRHLRSDRKPTWRPGGDHADPREKYKLTRDQKRARFKNRQRQTWKRAEEADGSKPGSQGAWKPRSRGPWKPADLRTGKPGSRGPWKPAGQRTGKPGSRGPWKAEGQRAGKRGRPGPRGPKRGR
jgi:hypothetical protein